MWRLCAGVTAAPGADEWHVNGTRWTLARVDEDGVLRVDGRRGCPFGRCWLPSLPSGRQVTRWRVNSDHRPPEQSENPSGARPRDRDTGNPEAMEQIGSYFPRSGAKATLVEARGSAAGRFSDSAETESEGNTRCRL